MLDSGREILRPHGWNRASGSAVPATNIAMTIAENTWATREVASGTVVLALPKPNVPPRYQWM